MALGIRMSKNKVNFIMTGSVVVDEDKEYFVREWSDYYNTTKIKIKPNLNLYLLIFKKNIY